MGARLSDVKREAILADIRTGVKARNKIALEHDVSAGTVTNIAREAGLTEAFDRSKTKSATEAVVADNRALRALTSRRWLEKCNQLLDKTERPYVAFAFGGKDNTYNEHLMDEPPVDALRSLVTAAAVAFDKHMAQDKHDADETRDLNSVDAWLDSLTSGAGH
jgi:hypothetical protein